MVHGGIEFVRIAKGVGATLTVIERTFWTEVPFESRNLNSGSVVPVAVGVPNVFPVDGFNTSPLGNGGDPAARLQA